MSARRPGRGTSRSPLQQALALLTRREHSSAELTAKLSARGCTPDEIEAVMARLAEGNWQSDARFAESLVRHRAASGYGPRWIRAELGTHRVEHALIESALEGFDGDWQQLAWDLLARRGLSPPEDGRAWPPAQKRKALELLARRGFSCPVWD